VCAGNAGELVPLLEHVARRTRARSFSFDLASSVGNATDLDGELTAEGVLRLFTAYRDAASRLREEGHRLRALEKPALFRVLSAVRARRKVFRPNGVAAVGGCLVGWDSLSILADGRVMACRRFPSVVGKLPEQSLGEIFYGAPLLRRFRRASQLTACGRCRFFAICRGCPAVGFGMTGDALGEQPLCFLPFLDGRSAAHVDDRTVVPDLAMGVSLEEERDLVASHIHNIADGRFAVHLQSPEYRKALLLLAAAGEKRRFVADPHGWLASKRINLDEVGALCAFIVSQRHFRDDPLAGVGVAPCLRFDT